MAIDDKKEEEQEEELIPVGEDVDDNEHVDKDQDEEDKKNDDDDDESDEEEEETEDRLGASEDDEEEDGKKARRKKERKTRSQRAKAARARDKQELDFQHRLIDKQDARIAALEGRQGTSEIVQVDARIADAKSKIKLADQVISKAIQKSDGDAMVEAQGIRDGLRDDLNQLNYAKQSLNQRQEVEPPDPVLVGHASRFVAKHEWWDPEGRDEDSRKVSKIDAQLVKEQYDPLTPEYWDELAARVEKEIPHRFDEEEDVDSGNGARKPKKKKKKSGGPTMSVGGRERPLKKNEVYISPERKAAMVEAGIWDDPIERQRYLKSYARYDRDASASNA